MLNSVGSTEVPELENHSLKSAQRIHCHFFPGDFKRIVQHHNVIGILMGSIVFHDDRSTVSVFSCENDLFSKHSRDIGNDDLFGISARTNQHRDRITDTYSLK